MSQIIKQRNGNLEYPFIPDDNHPRNYRIQRTRAALVEKEYMRKNENSADSRPNVSNRPPLIEIFTQSDLKEPIFENQKEPERERLLENKDSSDLSYPQIIPFRENPVYDTYEPIQPGQVQISNEKK